MGFLNPFMLLGITAVSVPIIIHLLNRRKFQKVVWAAMRFLQISVERNQRRMRIEDLILLALRCLLLALLAIALARPALRTAATDLFGQSKVTAVVVLDNSYSMGMSDGAQTRFEKARQAAEQALETMPAGSSAAILLASDVVDAVIPEPTFDFNLARKTIRDANLTDRSSDLAPAVDRAIAILRDRLAIRKELYLITDGQLSGWKQLGEIQKALEQVKDDIRSHVVLVNEREERNLGVSGLRMASGLTPAKQPLRFETRVTNFGQEEMRDVRVSLVVDSEAPSDEFTIDLLPAGSSKSVSLFAKLRTEGFHAVTAQIAEDRLPADDKRTVALRAIKEVRVLLVDGQVGSEARESQTFFLRHALVPVAPSEAADYFIKTSQLPLAELAGARFDDFDTVVLANVPDFSESTANAFAQYLQRGGGLIIFPGNRLNPTFYNEVLARKYKLLPAMFGSPWGQAEQEENYFSLQDKGLEHGIVSLWNDPGAGTLSSARFFRAYELAPIPPSSEHATNENRGKLSIQESGHPQVIVRFANGNPAAVEHSFGLGRVVMFASSADTSWNDLPVRPAFVPLIHRTLGSIVQRQDEGLNIAVGQKFVRRANPELLNQNASIFKPRQTEVVRELRPIELVNGWPMFQYDQTDLSGAYRITVAEPQTSLFFAAQSDAAESSLDVLSAEQRRLLGQIAHLVEWAPNISFKAQVNRERIGLEFWLPIILAALAIAALESILGQWFSRSK